MINGLKNLVMESKFIPKKIFDKLKPADKEKILKAEKKYEKAQNKQTT